MKGQSLAFKSTRLAAGLQHSCSLKAAKEASRESKGIQCLSTACPRLKKEDGPQKVDTADLKPKGTGAKHDKFANRDFFLSILGSTTTKRDTRAYVKHFAPPKETSQKAEPSSSRTTKKLAGSPRSHGGVNLGSFYGSRAVENSPRFVQEPYTDFTSRLQNGPQHVALVKIRAPQEMSDENLDGVARTLSQLAKLGMISTVVVDCGVPSNGDNGRTDPQWKALVMTQVDRIVDTIDAQSVPGARKEDNIIGVLEKDLPHQPLSEFGGRTHIRYRKLLMTPLLRGIIPVVACIGYTDVSQQAVPVKADDVVLALTREFAGFGFNQTPAPDEDPNDTAEKLRSLRSQVLLDRLIIIDPLGGIPSSQRPNGYHVFLNMEQEYEVVKKDLLSAHGLQSTQNSTDTSKSSQVTDLGKSNPFSQFVETEFGTPTPSPEALATSDLSQGLSSASTIHLNNLELVRKVLSILPPTSSALLTTPTEAANSGNRSSSPTLTTGVGTRSHRNPLIHNLLTDKPVFSSSLPPSRLGPTNPTSSSTPTPATACHTTFAKRGMPVTIFPDPRTHPWRPPSPNNPGLSLRDARIDLPRLVHLINDSFDRKLDVPAYLERVDRRIAGVIIAGEYEGGALLTWELPPGIEPNSPEAEGRWVPYLDKLAVLKRSQGSGGVADVVFKAMVRDCFPEGLCWRSRSSNPVNKWYFERSRGTWRLPGSGWTMFWTTEGVEGGGGLFEDYRGVCESIQPTWMDKKGVLD
ncbi:hypothetical protein VF21_03996 [Pseudogymnoascus sp. 05NY08]|nr:hypothetical protein VF21_03996 [Pseudogymnoascus sp. 05NY08]